MKEVPEKSNNSISQKSSVSEFEKLSDEQLIYLAKTDKSPQVTSDCIGVLFNRYKNFVKIIARPYFLVGGSQEDLVQEGMLGVFKAFNTFNGKTLFKSYCYTCVKNEILTAIEKSNRDKNKPLINYISLSGYFDGGDMDKTEYTAVTLDNPETEYINRESETELLNKIKKQLSNLEYRILTYFLKGYSYEEIAIRIDKPVKSIDNALQRIRKKITINA